MYPDMTQTKTSTREGHGGDERREVKQKGGRETGRRKRNEVNRLGWRGDKVSGEETIRVI